MFRPFLDDKNENQWRSPSEGGYSNHCKSLKGQQSLTFLSLHISSDPCLRSHVEFPLNQLKEVALQRVNFPCPNPSNLRGNPCGCDDSAMHKRCFSRCCFPRWCSLPFRHVEKNVMAIFPMEFSWEETTIPWLPGWSHGLRVVSITVIYIVEEFYRQHDAGDQ